VTPASATITSGRSTNGNAQKTASRTRSEAIIKRRRENRSTSGPSARPIATIGRKSAISSAPTQVGEPVTSWTCTVSASAAR
jgi:hypothetical protein